MMFEQGDFIEVNFNPTVGHEPQKLRPALVVSDSYFNNVVSSLTVVCPITTNDNKHPLHVKIRNGNIVGGYICVEALRAIDLSAGKREVSHLGSSLDEKTMAEVLERIGAIFGI